MAALGHEDPAVRRKAASALAFTLLKPGTIPSKFGEAFARALSDSEWRVRMLIASLAGRVESQEVTEPLCRVMESDPEPKVRAAAARSLSHRHDPTYLPQLVRAAEDPDDGVMGTATAAVARLEPGHPVVRRNLARLLRAFRKGGFERMEAAMALGAVGTPDALDALLEALEERERFARHFALAGLMHAPRPERIKPVVRCLEDEYGSNRMMAASVLEQWEVEDLVELVAPLLNDGEWLVRMTGARVLHTRGDGRARATLERAAHSLREEERHYAQAVLDSVAMVDGEVSLM